MVHHTLATRRTMSEARTPDRKTCMKEAREGMMDNAMEELYKNTTSLEIDFGKCSRLLLKHWPKLGTDTSRMPTPKQEARLLLSDDPQVVRFASGMRDFRDALMLVEQARETMAGALVHLSGIQGEAEIDAEADAVQAEASDEAGTSDPATKKRKIFSPLTGFKAAGYKLARVQTSGEEDGVGVPVAEKPKEICMDGPDVDGEYNAWAKVRKRVVVSSHCEKASPVVNALVEAERLMNFVQLESEMLSDHVRCDGMFLEDYGLDVVMGESPEHHVPPDVRVRFHSDADLIHEDVHSFKAKLRQLAFSMHEARTSYERIRDSMRLKECELFFFDMKHASGSK